MNAAQHIEDKMCLSELLKGVLEIPSEMDVIVQGIESDSRRMGKGFVFCACKGEKYDGRDYIENAISKGVSAILVDKDVTYNIIEIRNGVPIIPIENLSKCLPGLAAKFFSYPAKHIWLIGITGTNGKTSCCQFIAQMYCATGVQCGVGGTLGNGLFSANTGRVVSVLSDSSANDSVSSAVPGTTSDAVTIQSLMAALKNEGAHVMSMEVSSHGLDQNRVNVSEFDVAVFTNLTRDHLDYHGSMEAYGKAKQKLFNSELKLAVVNLDDEFSSSLLDGLKDNVKVYTYSLDNENADVFCEGISCHESGVSLSVITPWGKKMIESTLLGSFNVSNLLAALTTFLSSESVKADFVFDEKISTVNSVTSVRGRMERVGDMPVSVIVDYAHTPDGMKTALEAVREHNAGQIWCVFGCGGERDKGKRPLMAEIVEDLADKVVVTDDNPREESSEQIIQHVMSGFENPEKVTVESDRARAIEYAVASANEGDVVLIAGKGHEEYQDIGGSRMVFSDTKQARLCLNRRFLSGVDGK